MAETGNPTLPTHVPRNRFLLAALFLALLLGLWLLVRVTLLANEVALIEDGRMAVLGLHGRTEVFACADELSACETEMPPGPEARRLIDDAIAYYEGADLLYRSGALTAPPRPAAAARERSLEASPTPRPAGIGGTSHGAS